MWTEEYEHDEFGSIAIPWDDEEPIRSHLVAMQSEFWTPAEEVEDCLRWARNLQCSDADEGGDGGTRHI